MVISGTSRLKTVFGVRSFIVTAASAAVLLTGMAQAEPPEPLREAAMDAVLSNPEVDARWHAFRASGEEGRSAAGGFGPEVDANARWGYEERRFSGDRDDTFSRNPGGVDLTLTQMLYDGFETASEVRRLSEIERVRYFELLETIDEVALEAVRAFADVQRQLELVNLAQENFNAHQQVYDRILDRAERGVGRGVDLEQASGRLALAESNLLTERQNLHDVSARYYRVVGEMPAEVQVDLEGSFSESDIPESVNNALDEALTSNPAMFASMRNMRAASEQRGVARSAFHPRVDLQLRHAYENDVFEDDDIRSRDTSATVVMTWNLFRSGTDRARVRQFNEEFNEARDQQEIVCRNVRQTVSIAYNDIRSLQSQLNFLRQHRDTTDRVRTAYRQQFDIGERSLLDLLDTENEYFEASRAYANALHDLEVARAQVLNGLGRLTEHLDISRAELPSPADLGLVDESDLLTPDSICPPDSPQMVEHSEPTPAPEPTPEPMSVDSETLFGFDSAELTSEGEEALRGVIERINAMERVDSIEVGGHADRVGSADYNQDLSERRAAAVRDFLVDEGVDEGIITSRGYGQDQPIQECDADLSQSELLECLAPNRRVEILVEGSS